MFVATSSPWSSEPVVLLKPISSVSVLGFSDIISIPASHHPDVDSHLYTVAPPAVDFAVGCCPNCSLGLHLLATLVITTLDAPTIYSSVGSLPICLPVFSSPSPTPQPPPKPPHSLPPSFVCFLFWHEVTPSGRGCNVTNIQLF